MPDRVLLYGLDVEEVVSTLREDIRGQCGGSACVTLDVQPPRFGEKKCPIRFDKTVPGRGTEVPRESTIEVLTFRRCDPTPETPDTPDTPETPDTPDTEETTTEPAAG